MKKIIALVLAVVLLVACSSVLFVSAEESGFGPKKALTAGAEGGEASGAYEEEIAAKVGEPNAGAKFDVALNSEVAEDGKTVSVTLSIENITEKLIGVVFDLCYDAERMTLTTEQNKDNSLNFGHEGFGDKWENLTKIGEEEGIIEFQMLVVEDLSQVLQPGSAYTATFTFALNEGYETAGAWVPSEKTDGMVIGFQQCKGNGSYAIALPPQTYADLIGAKVGKKNESAAFDVILDSCAEKDGKTVKVTLSVGNITGELTGIVFPICYDAERLTLIASKNADGTIAFAREGFGSKWENLTTAKADEGKIEFQMIVADDLTQVLKAGGTYTATFTFELKDGYDEAGLWIANDAVRGMTKDFRRCSGNGSYTIAERQEGLIPLHIELSGKGSVRVNDQTIRCEKETVEEEIDLLPSESRITISIVPESGYHIASITVDGVDYSVRETLELNLTDETFVVITFEPTGDANGDGKLDAFDYQMLKAFVTGAYTGANDEQKLSMDVNHDGRIDAFDYQMLKAHVLGTYVIK